MKKRTKKAIIILAICFGSLILLWLSILIPHLINNVEPDVNYYGTPDKAAFYRTSEDFEKLTGAKFPTLKIVDSLQRSCFRYLCNEWIFIPQEPIEPFYKYFDSMCKKSAYWYDDEDSYFFNLYTDSINIDLSSGTDYERWVKYEGRMVRDRQGRCINVLIAADTIRLQEEFGY